MNRVRLNATLKKIIASKTQQQILDCQESERSGLKQLLEVLARKSSGLFPQVERLTENWLSVIDDAIEDRGGDKTRQEIQAKFGDKVAEIVEGCTESDITPKPPWKERKLATINKLRHASPEVRRVTLADKVHNARSILGDWYRIGDKVWERFKTGKTGTLWYFKSIAEVDRQLGSSYLGAELVRVVAQLQQNDN